MGASVSPSCQRCKGSLAYHESLQAITAAQLQTLTYRATSNAWGSFDLDVESNGLSNLIKANPLTFKEKDAVFDLDSLEKLLDHVSAESSLELPLCGDCAESVKDSLKVQYDEACQERDIHVRLLNKLRSEPEASTDDVVATNQELAALNNQINQALGELQAAEQDLKEAEAQLRVAEQAESAQSMEKEQYFMECNETELKLNQIQMESNRLSAMCKYQVEQLSKLQKANVYNDVFSIGHDGHFGTINGLRLGRLREKQVDWTEVNAALGQTVFLLATVAHRLAIDLSPYRLRPMGSTSRIEYMPPTDSTVTESSASSDHAKSNRSNTVVHELFCSGDFSLERLFHPQKFDAAMVALLEVLNIIGSHVEETDSNLRLPYSMSDGKISGHSVRFSASPSNESWTAACKFILANCKWILAYTAML